MTPKFTDFEKIPITLSVKDLANILGIGKPAAYNLVKRSDFPSIQIGKRIITPKEQFIQWLAQQAEKGGEI